jgi:hypothetical protein
MVNQHGLAVRRMNKSVRVSTNLDERFAWRGREHSRCLLFNLFSASGGQTKLYIVSNVYMFTWCDGWSCPTEPTRSSVEYPSWRIPHATEAVPFGNSPDAFKR